VLVLASCVAVGGRAVDALHAGAAIEILHNFTLVHDDIMDNAESRRGRMTVHRRWDTNVAILVGDELLARAYRTLLRTRSPRIREITQVFTEGVVEVCEGQAYDKEFEARRRVTVNDYLLMIRKKTGKMVAVSTEIGALIGGGTPEEIAALRTYGELVGRAFQIQDDLLDIIGDEKTFGKRIGGDLREGKKTYLLLEALRCTRGTERKLLERVLAKKPVSPAHVRRIRDIYESSGVVDAARRRIAGDIRRATRELGCLPAGDGRAMLHWLTDMLLHRTF
jgi:geranylgeranyl diphosphate synthase type II